MDRSYNKGYTKWVEAASVKRASGAAVVNFICDNVICRCGIPKGLLSDNSTPFINAMYKNC